MLKSGCSNKLKENIDVFIFTNNLIKKLIFITLSVIIQELFNNDLFLYWEKHISLI